MALQGSHKRDADLIRLWLDRQRSSNTGSCYQRDAAACSNTSAASCWPASRLATSRPFDQSLIDSGLAPVSRQQTIAGVKILFGFGVGMYRFGADPAAELSFPR
jgi:hypothetical protein